MKIAAVAVALLGLLEDPQTPILHSIPTPLLALVLFAMGT